MKVIYGAAYYPEHRDPATWASDLDGMAAAHMNVARVGEFAWKRFEPRERAYDFGWMDRFVDLAGARGISVMMCPPLRTAPAWLVEKDPSILIVDSGGTRLEFGSRYTFCINHPVLRESGFALAASLARHYGPHPAVRSWHLDNEFGDEPDCHCPVCKQKWHAWLAARYGSVEAVNEAWGTVFWGLEFDHLGQVPTPRKTKSLLNPGLWQAWRQFRSDCTAETMRLHAEAMRPHIGGLPVTSNFQTLWNNHTDYPEAARCLDVSGLNYYPGFGPAARGRVLGLAAVRATKGRPIWVLETHGGPTHVPGHRNGTPDDGELTALCAHMIANGVDGIVFFRWACSPFGAEQHIMSIAGYDGRPRRGYEELKAVGAGLRRLAPLLAGSTVRSDVAVFYDFQTRWYLESSLENPASPWQGPRDLYLTRALLMYNTLKKQGLNVDVAGRHSDLAAYRLLVVPMLPSVDDALAGRLRAFVEAGGVLVWHPYSGFCDRDVTIYPRRLHPELERLLGIEVADFAPERPGEARPFEWNGRAFRGEWFHDLVTPAGADVVGRFTEGWMAGRPAVTARACGRGFAVHVATFAEDGFYGAFLPHWFPVAGVAPILAGAVPEGVEVCARTAADGARVVFLVNATARAVSVDLDREMIDHWGGERLRDRAPLGPYGVRVLTAAVRT